MKRKAKQKKLKSIEKYLGHPLQHSFQKKAKAKKLRVKKVCTNACPVADLWTNCAELIDQWTDDWMCQNNKNDTESQKRFKSCQAACTCQGKIKN